MENIMYLTVTALNKYIAKKFEVDPYLSEIYIKGEISNFKIHNNNNIYFSIKDENTRINAVQFGSKNLDFKDGDTVLIKARINFYLPRGEHNLYVIEMKKDKVGELYQKFLELKEKLEKEGLFSEKYKKRIPKISNTIAVVTAATGAAIQDIKRTIYRRYPLAKINVYSTLVQGENSVQDIVKNLLLANEDSNDIIILARGGGSIEDLWSFNSEEVVRAIFSCDKPVITGIGHETDTTLADYVADKRASTPTAAAEMVTPSIDDIKNYLLFNNKKLENLIHLKLKNMKSLVENNSNSYYIRNYSTVYDNYKKHLQLSEQAMLKFLQNQLNVKKINYVNKKDKFFDMDILEKYKNQFISKVEKLEANSPVNILTKGYSIAYKNNKKISTVNDIEKNDIIDIQLIDGSLNCEVKEVVKEGI